MKTKIFHSLPKFFVGILLWGTYFLPIVSFEKAFRILSVESNDYFGIYRDGIIVCSTIAIILTILFLWLSYKLFHNFLYKALIVITYLYFYYFACTSIAWDYRIVFGASWQWSEIFPGLVKPQWYFYVFGGLGLIFHYQFQALLQDKRIKK